MKIDLKRSIFQVAVMWVIACCSALAQSFPNGCYEFKSASFPNKRLTNANGVLKMQDANNSDNQIFYISDGTGSGGPTPVKILAQGANAGFVSTNSRDVGTPLSIMRAVDFPPANAIAPFQSGPRWRVAPVSDGTPNRYNITRYSENDFMYPVVGFGATNWGAGDPNSSGTDLYLVSASDLNIFGANKWDLVSKGCPTNYCDWQINAAPSNPNPVIGTQVINESRCTGNCEGVYYSWSYPPASAYGPTFPMTAGYDGVLGPYQVRCTASKPGCPSQTQYITFNVMPAQNGFTQCQEAETSTGTGAITSDPNASNGQTRGAENNNNHYVEYTITGVPYTATYNVTLRYYSSSAPSVNVSVSQSGFSQNVNLPNSGAWNIVPTEQTIAVNLASGNNTIRISGIGGGSCRQDKLCVNGLSNQRMSAEDIVADAEGQMKVSPNPNNGEFQVDFFMASGSQGRLSVADMQGIIVKEKKIIGKGNHKEKISLSGSPSGTYLVRIMRENGQEVKKVLVVR